MPISTITNNSVDAAAAIATSKLGAGAVLQAVNATLGAVDVNTTSTSFVTTGFSVSITPKFASSKILLFVNGGGQYNSASGQSIWSTIYRNSTNIGDATYGLSRIYAGAVLLVPHSFSIVDSPNTTSATTYTCYYRSASGLVQFQSTDRGIISFTAMEISQ